MNFEESKDIRKPTQSDLTHIAFWDSPPHQVINFWLRYFSDRQDGNIITSSDAYENAELSNYVYLNRERIVRELYRYLMETQ